MRLALACVSAALAAAAAYPPGPITLKSVASNGLYVRHCAFYVTAVPVPANLTDDYLVEIVPALNEDPNAVSFVATAYPGMYLSPCIDARRPGVESNRVCVLPSTSFPAEDGSFKIIPGLSNASLFSFQCMSNGTLGGAYISLNNQRTGGCPFPAPASDVVLTSSPPSAADATWALISPTPLPPIVINIDSSTVTHTIPPLYLGCHSDSGFTHQARGFYSQMIYGKAFEFGVWPNNISTGTAVGSKGLDQSRSFGNVSLPSLRLVYEGGSGIYGVSNRGLGNHGYALQAGKPYDGYLYVKGTTGAAVSISVSLADTNTGDSDLLDQSVFQFSDDGSSSWERLNFTLTPSASTNCVGITPGSDPNIQCGNL